VSGPAAAATFPTGRQGSDVADRATARTVGVLFVVASLSAIVGGSLVLPVEDASTPAELAGDRGQVVTGVVLELVLVLSVVGIAVMIFPVLRRRAEGLAMGYVAVRTLEAVALLAATASAVVAVALADDGAASGSAEVGGLVVATRQWTYRIGSLVLLGVGALILYGLLQRARLVPTWLAVWGLAGAGLVLLRGVLELYGVDLSGVVAGLMAAPIGINEMVLAVWLIVRGFAGPPAVPSGP
jgi:hypothetical protein